MVIDAQLDADGDAGTSPAPSGAPSVKSAERALQILELLSTSREPIAVSVLRTLTGYPRSSLHQLLRTMAAMRWIDYSQNNLSVGIGFRPLVVGTSYLDRDQALQPSLRTLELIRDETGYTTHYARLEEQSVIYLATRQSREPHRISSRVGRQLPAHATSLGKVLLAELSPAEVTAIYPPGQQLVGLTENTITTSSELHAELERIRARGYSTEYEENTPDVVCVGVALHYRIPATDAISCSIPLANASGEELERVAQILLRRVGELAAQLRREGIR